MVEIEKLLDELEKAISIQKDGFDQKIALKLRKIISMIDCNNSQTYSDGNSLSFLNQKYT